MYAYFNVGTIDGYGIRVLCMYVHDILVHLTYIHEASHEASQHTKVHTFMLCTYTSSNVRLPATSTTTTTAGSGLVNTELQFPQGR